MPSAPYVRCTNFRPFFYAPAVSYAQHFFPHVHYFVRPLLHASISSYAHCPIRIMDQLPPMKIFYCYSYLFSSLESPYFGGFETWISRRGLANVFESFVLDCEYMPIQGLSKKHPIFGNKAHNTMNITSFI